MPYDEILAKRVLGNLKRRGDFVPKKMFGGVAYLLDGNMCCGVLRELLMLRVGPDAYPAMLKQPHIRKFDFTGREMRGWVVVEPEGIAEENELRRLLDQAVEFTRTLPPKDLTEKE